ncbi:MAG: hypothetical protein FJ026_02975 [Chloroflexi bacterium]|nr:hypothetical protein [Chloroflexota bacterium]
MAENDIVRSIRKKITTEVAIAFVLGLVLGLFVLGWWLWPVKWTNADLSDLRASHKENHMQLIADSYALTGNSELARARLQQLKAPGEKDTDLSTALAALVRSRLDAGKADEAMRVQGLLSAASLPPVPTPQPATGQPTAAARSPLLRIVGIVFFLLLLGAGVALLLGQLQKRPAVRRRSPTAAEPSFEPILEAEREVTASPVSEGFVGHFETTYSVGDEGYDASYSLESPTGEFLGDCGISALEDILAGEPDKVVAFELWLFDKDDVRTETKILLSEGAFADEAVRESLASKGELIRAEEGQIIILETANLRMDAKISELEYDSAANSAFARLSTVLDVLHR